MADPGDPAVGTDKVHAFVRQSPELAHRFGFFLDDALRYAPHTLRGGVGRRDGGGGRRAAPARHDLHPARQWRAAAPHRDAVGRNEGYARHHHLRQNAANPPNRDDRKPVFDAFWASWTTYEGTFGATLTTQVWARSSTPRCATSRCPLRRHLRRQHAGGGLSPCSWPRPMRACRALSLPGATQERSASGDLHYYDHLSADIHAQDQPPQFNCRDSK